MNRIEEIWEKSLDRRERKQNLILAGIITLIAGLLLAHLKVI